MGLANEQQTKNQTAPAPDAISPEVIDSLTKALKHHKNEQLKPAEKLYKKALAASKNHTDVALMVAIFYQQIGRNKYVITLLKKALLNAPHHFKVHFLLGKAYLEEKQYEKALPHFKEAHIQDPDNQEVCLKFGLSLHRMGQLDPVLPLYKKAIERKDTLQESDRIQLYKAIADLFATNNQRDQSKQYLKDAVNEGIIDYGIFIRLAIISGEGSDEYLKNIIRAYQLNPHRIHAKTMLAQACEINTLPSISQNELKIYIQSCFNSNSINHQSLAIPWVKNFFSLIKSNQSEQLLEADNYTTFTLLTQHDELRNAFFDDYFYTGLKCIQPNNYKIERLYTHFRKSYLLKVAEDKPLSNDDLSFLSAMAQQCFLNEYIFKVTKEEKNYIEKIKHELNNKKFFEKSDHTNILLLACYEPLLSLKNYQNLQNIKNTPHMNELVEVQINEPLEEIKLQKTIPSFGNLKNQVSLKVQEQYEENPYPRFKTVSIFTPIHLKSIESKYRPEYKVLIAGCGTGSQILTTYNCYPKADFTAIDITKASLGYAKRKLKEHGLEKKVKLLHCDILEVENLHKEFEHIESYGVLHHMENPLEGLKALSNTLKPSGIFEIGLYSALGRENIFKTRELIQKHGFDSSPEGIRACRELIIEQKFTGLTNYPIYKTRDFFSLSNCRDLLFHVQEKCYNLYEISDMLQKANLSFNGFIIPKRIKNIFVDMFPKEEQLNDLECWAKFEEKNTTTFAGMYKFRTIKNP